MLKTLRHAFYVVIISCPDGLAAALTGVLLELVYRVAVSLGLLNSGAEYYALATGVGVFIVLFGYRAARYFIRYIRGRNED